MLWKREESTELGLDLKTNKQKNPTAIFLMLKLYYVLFSVMHNRYPGTVSFVL